MFAFMIIVAGAAVALAAYFLISGLAGDAPSFDVETVEGLGLLSSVVVFGICGPVLVMKEVGRTNLAALGIFLAAISVTWSGAVGLVAVEAARVTLAL